MNTVNVFVFIVKNDQSNANNYTNYGSNIKLSTLELEVQIGYILFYTVLANEKDLEEI